MTRTYVDIHVLQTVPPSNLNRDDAGSPKQAVYGGVRRARVSSQSWKRATRRAFTDHFQAEELGSRTKRISQLLTGEIMQRAGLDETDATRIATTLLAPLGITPGRRESETAYLLFFGRSQLEALADLVAGDAAELAVLDDAALKERLADRSAKQVLGTGHPIDVALFGRMVADIPGLNVDAATQVAHAISTHPVEIEFDYFTAVDDEKDRDTDDAGAAMIGTVEFNSATLYRFATVALHQLAENLGDDKAAEKALTAFLTSFATSMPTGHENSFAHRTAPELVTIAVREDQPVNLVSAFEAPVRAEGEGIAQQSMRRLAAELSDAADVWGLRPISIASTFSARDAEKPGMEALGDPMPFHQAVQQSVAEACRRLPARSADV